MNRVSVTKTGKLIEFQSGGDEDLALKGARLDTLRQNAINAGYASSDFDVSWVTDEQLAVLQSASSHQQSVVNLQISNYSAVKQVKVNKLFKQGKIAEAITLKGGLV